MNFPDGIAIKSFYVYVSSYPQSALVNVSAHRVNTITLRASGCKEISFAQGSGKTFVSPAGSITFIPRGFAYAEKATEAGRVISLHFETHGDIPDAIPFVFLPKNIPGVTFENIFKELCAKFRIDRRWDYSCVSLVYELFGLIKKETDSGQVKAVPKRIKAAKDYIDKNFESSDISVEMLAETAKVSSVYFRREFRECFGFSPVEYIKFVRLENAKALLKTGLYSVSEVATRCGFDSISYFSSIFTKSCGVSPSRYAKL